MAPGGMSRSTATLLGFGAILLWALLALLTARTAPVPPFQLNAVCFAIGGALGLVWTLATGALPRLARVPPAAHLFGTAGLFGYHALYFAALRRAAPHHAEAETGLIAYLWPLLIVLLSGLLPGERLRAGHVAGAALAALGAALILARGGTGGGVGALPAYALGLLCALTWAVYSVGSRRFGAVPTAAVTVSCLASAALSLLLHLALEETRWPDAPGGWAALLALGAGPVGAAFFLWDAGMKRGDIQLLGTLSYAAPLLSTLVLVGAGIAAASGTLAAAAGLIAGGAALAARAGRRS